MTDGRPQTALIIGASRGLGLAVAGELLQRGWAVIGTVRGEKRTPLHDLADTEERLTVEVLDMTSTAQLDALRDRLAASRLDLLFVSGGASHGDAPVGEVTTESFVEVMVTNALSPLRVVETLDELVPDSGTIGIMSSRQGSISLNTRGGYDVYRASKSALNQLFRSYAARHADDPRTLLLVHPGHVQTELGGPGARLTVDESARGIVDTVVAHRGDGGLQFLDYQNQVVPW